MTNLALLRKQCGLSQKGLAKELGTTQSVISILEVGALAERLEVRFVKPIATILQPMQLTIPE